MLARKAAKAAGTGPEPFRAPYGPWDQRLCLAPDGDMFASLAAGDATVLTGTIAAFERDGIRMTDGTHVPADLIVVATGLVLRLGGGAALSVEGRPLHFPDHVTYKGAMLSDVPNFAQMFGYTNASWTLKCELIARWVIRLLDRMEVLGVDVATPVAPDDLALQTAVPLSSGYIERARGALPLQGDRAPWKVHQNYLKDIREFRLAPIDDGALRLSRTPQPVSGAGHGARADRA